MQVSSIPKDAWDGICYAPSWGSQESICGRIGRAVLLIRKVPAEVLKVFESVGITWYFFNITLPKASSRLLTMPSQFLHVWLRDWTGLGDLDDPTQPRARFPPNSPIVSAF
jgi:hypothetical protein